jgi:preprotein translocase subunit SecG
MGAVGAMSILWFICLILAALFLANAFLMYWSRR